MDDDSYTEISRESWFSRIGNSIKGILFGLILFIAAFPLLWWNEGRSVERYNSLKEGESLVISVSSEHIDADNNGKLVYTQGLAQTQEQLSDPVFGVSEVALKLIRSVQMYQWREQVRTETQEEIGGSKTTKKIYSYNKGWEGRAINSAQFKKAGHDNPPMIYASQTFQAQQVTLGEFRLNAGQVSRIDNSKPLNVHAVTMPEQLSGKKVSKTGEGIYLGDNPSDPQIGDLQVSFQVVEATEISLVAEQRGSSFMAYQTQAGSPIDLLKIGTHSAEALFAAAHKENTFITWAIRIGATLIMWLGLSLVLRPLAVLGAVLPFLGNLIGMGIGVVTLLITIPCAAVTIALAWISYRPIVAGVLIAIAVASLLTIKFLPKREQQHQHA